MLFNATLSVSILAGLLRDEDPRAEPNTLEYLVTHRSQKFWLSSDSPYVRTPSPIHTLKSKSSTITIGTSLTLNIHVIINRQLTFLLTYTLHNRIILESS